MISRVLGTRNLAQWCDVPFEAIEAMPAQARERLAEYVAARDRAVVQDRGD